MHVEEALSAIKDWYDGEGYVISGITTEPKGDAERFEQHPAFLSVIGYQHNGYGEDDYHGKIYFEYAEGRFIATDFWAS